jgi:poly(3-hydroxybutyrate) depolymerase
MALRFSTSFAHVIALSVLASSYVLPAYASSGSKTNVFEPPLRELWVRGSERFQRQWLVAGPVAVAAAQDIDVSSLRPAVGAALSSREPAVRWSPHTSWSDITDLTTLGGRAPDTTGASIDRFVYVAASLPSATAGPMDLSIGSERPYSVWLNDRLVHTREAADVFVPDLDRLPVDMKRGENFVLLRFHETSGGTSQFSLRAVPRGSALRKVQEIAPSLVQSNNESLAVRTHFVVENDAKPVSVEVLRAGGAIVARQQAKRGEIVRFDSKRWSDGAYEIRASTQDAWNRREVRHLAWYKGDAIVAVHELIDAANKAERSTRGDTIRMLAAMAKDRLGGSVEKASPSAWRLVHSPLMEFEELDLEEQGREARLRSGGFVRLAYTDDVDGSTQWCRAFIPLDYSPKKRWPLIAFLHGFNPPNPQYVDWWGVDERHNPVADTRPTIVVEPHGRGNAQYLGVGERDVMRCIAEAKQRFSVDEDRVYLTGESMGGHGTWAIASRHPDIFAAAAPVYGGWDFRITNVANVISAPAPTTEVSAFGFERASSFSHAENLLHVPLLVVHGDADASVHVENSRHAVRLLQRWGYDVRYHEMPGWAHEDLGQRGTIADWLLTHTRDSAPRTVRLRSTDLAGASAYWVRVRAFDNPAEVIRVHAEFLQPGVVRIDSSNAAALALEVPKAFEGSDDMLRVIWNGEAREISTKDGAVELGSMPSAALHKRPGSEGPLPAVIATPFAVVVGTISPDVSMREIIQARADAFAQQWLAWQHQPLRVLKDMEITREHERTYSLLLLGGAEANAVTQRFAKKLPFSASRHGIHVDDVKFAVTDSVLQAIYPNPGTEDRYLYVVAPTSSAGMYFWKPQLVDFIQGFPVTNYDWIIQDGRRAPPGTTDPQAANVASGMFDASWRRQDRWTVLRDETTASQWTLRRAPGKDFEPSSSALQAAAGSYELFPGFILTFRSDDGNLVVDVPGEQTIPTIAESDMIFVDPKTGNAIEIVRDETGKVTGASVDSPLGILFAKRVP